MILCVFMWFLNDMIWFWLNTLAQPCRWARLRRAPAARRALFSRSEPTRPGRRLAQAVAARLAGARTVAAFRDVHADGQRLRTMALARQCRPATCVCVCVSANMADECFLSTHTWSHSAAALSTDHSLSSGQQARPVA